ncbi:MAG: phosphoribosylformylglycinamidine synthase subunit PurS [Nitrosotalea sp.]
MPSFRINVVIENKPDIVDPEGDTILNDLILKDKKTTIKKVRSAKMLRFVMDAKNKESAEKTVLGICNEFRIFNPLVSKVSVETLDA